jgi:hypothetical protein
MYWRYRYVFKHWSVWANLVARHRARRYSISRQVLASISLVTHCVAVTILSHTSFIYVFSPFVLKTVRACVRDESHPTRSKGKGKGKVVPSSALGSTAQLRTWPPPQNFLEASQQLAKLSLCFFNWAPRQEGVLGELKYSSTHSLTTALDGGEWSASRHGRFTPREGAPGTHWIVGWVGTRAVLDAVVKGKILSPAGNRTLELLSSSP